MFCRQSAVAVVTGASSGIGRAVSQGLAEEGVTVCVVGRNSEELRQLERHGADSSGRLKAFTADLAKDEDIDSLADELNSTFNGIDILVHSAGINILGSVASSAVADLDYMYRVNMRAPFLLTQKLLTSLDNKNGQVVFINSSAGMSAKPGAVPYAATKHALKAFADGLRQEVNSRQIRVLTVYPGRTATPGQQEVLRLEGRVCEPERLLQPADVASVIVSSLRLPRTAEVTDINIRHHIKIGQPDK